MKLFNPENAHWYRRDGEPLHSVPSAKGEPRPTTLRDARKLGLLPSVTNVLGVIAKPELTAWVQETGGDGGADAAAHRGRRRRCVRQAGRRGLADHPRQRGGFRHGVSRRRGARRADAGSGPGRIPRRLGCGITAIGIRRRCVRCTGRSGCWSSRCAGSPARRTCSSSTASTG